MVTLFRAPRLQPRALSTAAAHVVPSIDGAGKRICENCESRPKVHAADVGQGLGKDPLSRRSFYQRELPSNLVGFSSAEGKRRFLEAAASGTAEGAQA